MTVEQKDDSVLKDRHKWLGGSDMRHVFGSRNDLVTLAYNKAHNVKNEFSSKYTDYGNKMEPIIREEMEQILGLNFPEWNNIQDIDNKIRGNFDGYNEETNTILEIKTAVATKTFADAIENYKYQLLTYSYLMGGTSVILAVLKNEDFKPYIDEYSDLSYQEFSYDELLELCKLTTDKFLKGVTKFWLEVDKQKKIGKDVSLPQIDLKTYTYKQKMNELAELTSEVDKLKQQIEEEMKNNNHTKYSNKYVNITIVDPSYTEVFNLDKFKEENPEDVVNAYMKEEVTEEFNIDLFKEVNDEDVVNSYMNITKTEYFDEEEFKQKNPEEVVKDYIEQKITRKGLTRITIIDDEKKKKDGDEDSLLVIKLKEQDNVQ